MSKLNRRTSNAARPTGGGPIRALAEPETLTYEGAAGYTRDLLSDFLLLGVSMPTEGSFYETADARLSRFTGLARTIGRDNPEWMTGCIRHLRRHAHMRTAPLVAATAMARARQEAKLPGYTRQAVNAAVDRADEPGTLLNMWLTSYASARYERHLRPLTLPKGLRRGLADAVYRLYNQRSTLNWDSREAAVRFGDVVELIRPATHRPAIRGTEQGALLAYLLDRRHNRDKPIPEQLATIRSFTELMAVPADQRRDLLRSWGPEATYRLRQAGMSWKALTGWLETGMDTEAWIVALRLMRYEARLNNLRKFDRAGIPDEFAAEVAAQLANPDEVERARILPMKVLAAYLNTDSDRWRQPLADALTAALPRIPELPGRTLVLIDTSASMRHEVSDHSSMQYIHTAALFGIALAARNPGKVDVCGFADYTFQFHVPPGYVSVLQQVREFTRYIGYVGHGTKMWSALRTAFNGHDRIIILSDEQAAGPGHHSFSGQDPVTIHQAVPAGVPLFVFNIAGYQPSAIPAGFPNIHELCGLNDLSFDLIPLIEAGQRANWPWMNTRDSEAAA
ncbi:VWA domain-containing protein [Microbispora sp. NPDC049125]|uniref:VWA domain-containing protein n=1 Tax=Microbispora sp. NPDC049125 TaxID=3154929 RepID=UPI003467EAED